MAHLLLKTISADKKYIYPHRSLTSFNSRLVESTFQSIVNFMHQYSAMPRVNSQASAVETYDIYFLMGQSRPLFVYFRPFLITFSIIQIDNV